LQWRRLLAAASLFKLLINVSEAGELPGEFSSCARTGLASRMKILAAKEVAERDDGRTHRAIFVSALRPGGVLIEPEIEAHMTMVTAGYHRRHQ